MDKLNHLKLDWKQFERVVNTMIRSDRYE